MESTPNNNNNNNNNNNSNTYITVYSTDINIAIFFSANEIKLY